MIKKFWVVRSKTKLFTGLAFGVAGFMLFYSLLTVLVLEDRVPWRTGLLGPADSLAPKYLLLLLPLISLALCTLLHLLSRRESLPFRTKGKPTSEKERGVFQSFAVGENFLLSLLLAFLQLNRLDFAKGIAGFSLLIPALAVLAMLAFGLWSLRKLRQAEKE